MKLPKKCLVDTNVPKTANLATQPDPDSDVSNICVLACIEAVEHVNRGDWLEQRAKLVRPLFIQAVEKHWSRSAIKPNRLIAEIHG